jgi:hypothetical protein
MTAGQWGQGVVIFINIILLLNLIRLDVKHASLGTRSVLYGAHCFLFHWFFVARAWHALYGWRTVTDRYVGPVSLKDPRLWVVFFLHDIGYLGKEKMDDADGETHPQRGAAIVGRLFGGGWYWFSLLHSRYYAKSLNKQPSRLCVADKYSFVMTPRILYLPFVRATGEIDEYMRMDLTRRAAGENRREISYEDEKRVRQREELWFSDLKRYMNDWVQEHRHGADDTWTASQQPSVVGQNIPMDRSQLTESGVTR